MYIYIIASLDKWATLLAKNLLPLGANSFLERVAPIQEMVINGVLVVPEKNACFSESSLPLIDQLFNYQYISIHLEKEKEKKNKNMSLPSLFS